MYHASYEGVLTRSSGQSKVFYVLMEYAGGGLVYDYLYTTGPFPDEICKFYFNQLMNGIKAIHDAGFAHRDLKPENLLLDEKFNLKITDLGFSTSLIGKDEDGLL